MIDKLTYFLTRFKASLLAISISLLLLMVYCSRLPFIDNQLTGYDIDNNPYTAVGQRMTEIFASSQMVQIKVNPEQTHAFAFFEGLEEVENAIKSAFPGTRVESLHKAALLLFRKNDKYAAVREILTTALGLPVVRDLVSRDTTSVLMVAFLDSTRHFEPDAFDAIIQKKYSGIESMSAVSQFHIQSQIEKSILRDYMLLLPIILCIIIAYLLYTYRSPRAVLFSLINIAISVVPVIFFFTMFNVSINQITSTALPVVVILSLTNSIHLITGYINKSTVEDVDLRIRQTFRLYLIPSMLASLTTAIAFGSFLFSDSRYIRQFGLVTSLSVMAVFVLIYLVAPTILRLVGIGSEKGFNKTIGKILESFIVNHKQPISIALIIVLISSFFFASKIVFRTNLETFLPCRTPVYDANREICKAFHSLAELDILIEEKKSNPDSNRKEKNISELISVVSRFADEISGYPEVSSVQSIKDQLAFESQHALPGIRTTIFPRSRNPFVSKDQEKYRINVKMRNPDDIWQINYRLKSDFRKNEPAYTIEVYSDYLFFNYISSRVTVSLMKSLLISGLLIMIVLFLITKNLRYTSISILANLIPLGFLVVIFVVFGLEMNITTSITLVVCLGLIVDDTIHILYRRVCLLLPLGELGFGIVTTSTILAGGFFSFILSQSRPNQIFGLLCAMVFLIAVVSDLAVMTWLMDKNKNPRPGGS